ncbi:hypothetical protein BLS_001321 [Venturia inaequalis]|uniref:ATP synthase protein 8 n=1 Tax=Venturia inaequalis TaxID=5025 RepID=A0A8H3UVR5_VENIN|nr:hypothetical protein EG328_007061 [Venturia inaequalis]KAE9971990.1 hypothetical protein EG327_009661 [Venturia inaequalis]KAE9977534.1 hypothetical protein BLS_001321 [Venturia inaequalis]RDI88993.1 hypothetical protein Vi05172_g1492 [Venturia inaequalis]
MSSARILRPFARALQRPIARPTSYAAFSTKSAKVVAPSVTAQLQQAKTQQSSAKTIEPAQKMTKLNVLQAAMPQLVPFYFVNETTMAFVLLPTLIYLFSKYLLPQRVRVMAARLFISKL